MQRRDMWAAYKVKKCGFNGACCDCETLYFNVSNVKYSACRMYVYCVFISHCTCRYSICPVEHLSVEHVLAVAPASKTSTKPKLLSIQEKFDIINNVDPTANGTRNH